MDFLQQVVLTLGGSALVALIGYFSMAPLRSSEAKLNDARTAEIRQGLAKKELAPIIRRLKALEANDARKNKKISRLELALVDERGKRRELERGVGILVNQLTAIGQKPKWVPQAHTWRR